MSLYRRLSHGAFPGIPWGAVTWFPTVFSVGDHVDGVPATKNEGTNKMSEYIEPGIADNLSEIARAFTNLAKRVDASRVLCDPLKVRREIENIERKIEKVKDDLS